MDAIQPGLFGLKQTNRDFTQEKTWGKNQFNSSFPAALCCFLFAKNLDANYLCIQKGKFTQDFISINEVFGINPDDSDIYFAFESQYTPYQKHVIGSLERTDLVIQKRTTGECLSGLEVKLTALPDNTTCELDENLYGSEIVIRPSTIEYLACSIASAFSEKELSDMLPSIFIKDWTNANIVIKNIEFIISAIKKVSINLETSQKSFLIQPIWKTRSKSPELAENCLDVFIWSDAGFTNFISDIADKSANDSSINRITRTAIWLYKMLLDIKETKRFDYEQIIDSLSYNKKNDKAFSYTGKGTNKYMACPRLVKPAVLKSQIKEIILGGGQNLLSPERRFDAIIVNSPDLFL
ncbi:MAG: HindVP family restriction endonuclease [Cyanobacteriota bacterium]|jgi:hypothetical protein